MPFLVLVQFKKARQVGQGSLIEFVFGKDENRSGFFRLRPSIHARFPKDSSDDSFDGRGGAFAGKMPAWPDFRLENAQSIGCRTGTRNGAACRA